MLEGNNEGVTINGIAKNETMTIQAQEQTQAVWDEVVRRDTARNDAA
ncbi:MAG TPA: hypothetical protein VKB96_02355 [Gammaproteobacteria bacterium]|jgi:hypothetical protein|nr:hypothetical protein [Gammaproteobacteria bacterium]